MLDVGQWTRWRWVWSTEESWSPWSGSWRRHWWILLEKGGWNASAKNSRYNIDQIDGASWSTFLILWESFSHNSVFWDEPQQVALLSECSLAKTSQLSIQKHHLMDFCGFLWICWSIQEEKNPTKTLWMSVSFVSTSLSTLSRRVVQRSVSRRPPP